MCPMRLALLIILLAFASDASGQFHIRTDRVITDRFVGFGGQMNPYLWCRPNRGVVTDENVKDLERKVIDLAPQHVRVFTLLHWWNNEPDDVSYGDPRTKDSFFRTLDLAQRAGASINLTLWHGPYANPDRAAEQFAQVLAELIRQHKFSAVRYATIQNEPNDSEKISLEKYNRMYRTLDASLKRLGLRGQVQIVGGDLVSNHQEKWFANLAENLGDVCDGYSTHIYWDYWDTEKLVRRVSEVPRIVAALPVRKPIFVEEFGVRGHKDNPKDDAGHFENGAPIATTVLSAVQHAWFNLEALNRSYVATAQWELYDADYDVPMRYGAIGDARAGWPLRPGYHLLMLMTHTCRPGWQVLAVEGEQAGAHVAAMRGPKDELTAYVLNVSDRPQTIRVDGLPRERSFHAIPWNSAGDGKFSAASNSRTDSAGAVELVVPPGAVIALTTLDWQPMARGD